MDTILFLIGVTVIMLSNSLIAFVLGWLFTEVLPLPLSFKPFNCRGCITFWFNVLIGSSFACREVRYFPYADVADSVHTIVLYGLIGVSILVGLVSYLYIKLKYRIYE